MAVGRETPDGTSVPWKRAKQDLLSRHVNLEPGPDREIRQFRCLSLAPDDVAA